MEATSSARTARPAQPLRLLSLDGGGIRGLSELIILERIMHRVKLAGNLRDDPRPADYFDLICGTSTGGLIAILLGRLQLTVSEAIDTYCRLSKSVFSEQKAGWKDGTFKASRLEEAIKSVLEELYGDKKDRHRRMLASRNAICKTFVVAVPALNVDRPRLFRNYVSKNPYYNAKIWEVARATSAAPRFFKRISVGRLGMEEEFIDGALGYNNPAELAIREARDEYTQDQHVACILSIGTGRRRATGFQKPGNFQRVLPTELIETLKSIATSCERVAQEMQERYRNCPGLYHRLNVAVGMDDIALEEWDRLGEVTTHTQAYLDGPDVSREIDVIVKSLLGRPSGSYPLATLDGTVQESNKTKLPMFLYPSLAVVHFVNRPHHFDELHMHLRRPLTSSDNLTPKVVLLQGMGGCGKSQLALNYCQMSERKRKYSIILWIDATSPQTALQSISNIAKRWRKPGFQSGDQEGNLQFFHNSMNDEKGRWLLIFDNFDEPQAFSRKRIQEFIPRHGPGSVIITSRRAEVQALAHKFLNLDRLSEDESVDILLGRTKRAPNEDSRLECARIVERLGYHALAIDQAGAYMLTRGMEFASYLEFYGQQLKKVLNEAPNIWNYTKLSKDSAEGMKSCTIFATLELSLDSISGEEQEQKDKKHILTLMAFFDINKLKDTIFHPYGHGKKRWTISCQNIDHMAKDAFQDILSELHNLSLLQSLEINSSGAFFTIHPLVQDWLKARIGKEQAKQYVIESMQVLAEYLWANGARDQFGNTDFHAKQFMLAHVDATILAKQEFYNSWSFLQGSSLLDAGFAYYIILGNHGRYHQAAELCGTVLAGRTNESGEEHPNALAAMHNLSGYLRDQGKYEEAEPLLRKCVAIKIKILGKEAWDTLRSMNALTDLLIMQKKYEEADSTSEESMEVSVRVFGNDRMETISIITSRARVLRYLGNHSEAARMNKENLEISKRVLGFEHPQTVNIMNNISTCLQEVGRFEEAETLLRKALSLQEKIYGPNHPQTLTAILSLATNLYKQEKLTEVEELCKRAYPVFESVLGWQHPHSTNLLGWMAVCLRDLGKYEEQEKILNLVPVSWRARAEQWMKKQHRIAANK